jgi:uncharacterized membrane protein
MNAARWVDVQFTAVGLLIAGVAVPLVMGFVPAQPPVRLSLMKTLSDERIWYAANRVAGWDLLVAGLIIAAASLAVIAWGSGLTAATRMLVNVAVTVGALGLAVAHSAVALGRL